MPNFVFSKLTIDGDNAEDLMLSLCAKDKNGEFLKNDEGELCFDFNKIIPMPESLNIISGSITDTCMKIYVNSLLEGCEAHEKYMKAYTDCEKGRCHIWGFNPVMSEEEFWAAIKRMLEVCDGKDSFSNAPHFKTKADVFAYGKRALDNFIEYGAKDWYDWCNKNWGTKWNAGHSIVEGCTAWFQTAWADVSDLIQELSRQHPDYVFHYEYAEEEVGHYVGWAEFKNGEKISGVRYDDYTKEAFEQAFELAGGEEDYEYDEESGNYKFIGEE